MTNLKPTHLAVCFFALLFSTLSFSQDIIYFEDGEQLECEVVLISEKNVSYIRSSEVYEDDNSIDEEEEEEYTPQDNSDIKPTKINTKKRPVEYIKLRTPEKFFLKSDNVTYIDSTYRIREEYPEAFTTPIAQGKVNLYLFHFGKPAKKKEKKKPEVETESDSTAIKLPFTKGIYSMPTAWAIHRDTDIAADWPEKKISNKRAFKAYMSNFFDDCPELVKKVNSKEYDKVLLMIARVKKMVDYYNTECFN